jgi:hypothetical protein
MKSQLSYADLLRQHLAQRHAIETLASCPPAGVETLHRLPHRQEHGELDHQHEPEDGLDPTYLHCPGCGSTHLETAETVAGQAGCVVHIDLDTGEGELDWQDGRRSHLLGQLHRRRWTTRAAWSSGATAAATSSGTIGCAMSGEGLRCLSSIWSSATTSTANTSSSSARTTYRVRTTCSPSVSSSSSPSAVSGWRSFPWAAPARSPDAAPSASFAVAGWTRPRRTGTGGAGLASAAGTSG